MTLRDMVTPNVLKAGLVVTIDVRAVGHSRSVEGECQRPKKSVEGLHFNSAAPRPVARYTTNLAQMSDILDAVRAGASPATLAETSMPATYRAVFVRRDEQTMFEGMASRDKDPRRSLHVDEVALPELAPDEVFIAVMASSINFNTVWTSIFEPLPTFGFLDRLAKESVWGQRHALDYHVVGSDAAGVIVRAGSAVRNWKIGDEVTVHCNYVDDQDPSSHDDSMRSDNQRIWGFETNFGGLADIAAVKANQLMPKATHLTWEESAVNALCNSTAYRMLVSRNGAPVTQGDRVLIWGASGGLGSFAVQHVLNSGGTPIGVGVERE